MNSETNDAQDKLDEPGAVLGNEYDKIIVDDVQDKLDKMAAILDAVNEKRKVAFASFAAPSCRKCYGKGWYSVRIPKEAFATIESCSCALKNHRAKAVEEMKRLEEAEAESGPVTSVSGE